MVTIPTYLLGDSEPLPLFLEKRAYQGSSGKVYPYRVTDRLTGKKQDKEYSAITLENDYIKVVILPELGGRIQIAYDKIKERHCIYHNQVIKPALVGLTGPWISGGIEFNWPQHHRPSTFEPVEYFIEEKDLSVAVYLGELERMNGLQQSLCVRLYSDKSYIELSGRIFNTSSLPQNFLWWANPAVKAGNGHQSIFPPDVTAVYDHGKRDVSSFPIATQEYYKADYSAGVDISQYKNIPVPTSYMAWKSDYDFVGAYVHEEQGGLLHVANRHIAPGKKQWTWGNGDFGQVWDRNLTDEDGPYIELMTGVYTDNQPDFTWLDPYEEKEFVQYFMPYRNLGRVHNASNRMALKCELLLQKGKTVLSAGILSFGNEHNVCVEIVVKDTVLCSETISLHPKIVWERTYDVECTEEDIRMCIKDEYGQTILEYKAKKWSLEEIPEPASSPPPPKEVQHEDELFLIAQHIELYRNPSLEAEEYYKEMIVRDSHNYRANVAMARMCLRSFLYDDALKYVSTALKRQTMYNTNPIDGEASYLKGLALFHLKREKEALHCFYKSTWSQNYKASSLYYISIIYCRTRQWHQALEHVDKALDEQGKNWQAQGLRLYILRNLSQQDKAKEYLQSIMTKQPLHMILTLEQSLLEGDGISEAWLSLLRKDTHNLLSTAFQYALWGDYAFALDIVKKIPENQDPMQYYSLAYLLHVQQLPYDAILEKAETCDNFLHFPNKESDYMVLQFVVSQKSDSLAQYHLGNLLYDRKRYDEAYMCWNALSHYAPARRNCSIYLYNKKKLGDKALTEIQKALELTSPQYSARTVFEYYYLLRMNGVSAEQRNVIFEKFDAYTLSRDDILIEWMQTQLLLHKYQEVLDHIEQHEFHPWEGGEGKVSECFVAASIGVSLQEYTKGRYEQAIALLKNALVYPDTINEGKLINTTDNDIYYILGCIQEKAHHTEDAVTSFQYATKGRAEINATSYYNDAPLEYVFYQAMAHRKLKDEVTANKLCYQLISFGERNKDKQLQEDFFAVSMPDFNVYEIDRQKEFHEKCIFSLMLGFYGMNDTEKYRYFRDMLLQKNKNHRQAVSTDYILHTL